ncbi:perosamine synthetase [Paenibacillus taihuensis]|uniref:Perosamine synthetase n=1 Tax=Paenibacillus taihuensis TaxID=1156355 RepID=A0A3D9S6R8_9BACL|nr:LegC family aminotransferase [Paenibacillus taihuensis]REE84505.1 perosamine synthetase [Paenibacillus taihuensis]
MEIRWANAVVDAIKEVVGYQDQAISLHEPRFDETDLAFVTDCVRSGWVSSVGAYVDRFEKMLSERMDGAHVVAVVNGTAALHISLKLAGVEQNDEVLTPALTFIATANAVSYCGAIPHLVDSESVSCGMDARKLADYLQEIAVIRGAECYNSLTGRRIKAAVPMHVFGHPVDMDMLNEVCARYHITVVEDAAEALGSLYKGRSAGALSEVGALSFNGNKIITTGGGGAIITRKPEVAKMAKHWTTMARIPHRWAYEHDVIGYNYRLPNLNAALGCSQLERLDGMLSRKRALASRYADVFQHHQLDVSVLMEPNHAASNYWLNSLILSESTAQFRDELLEVTNDQGIMTRPVWSLLHRMPMYSDVPRMDLTVAERLEATIINVPSSPFLGSKEMRDSIVSEHTRN